MVKKTRAQTNLRMLQTSVESQNESAMTQTGTTSTEIEPASTEIPSTVKTGISPVNENSNVSNLESDKENVQEWTLR